jgi:hypothetical protein
MRDLQLSKILHLLSLKWQSFETLKYASGFTGGELSKRLGILKRKGLAENELRTLFLDHVLHTQRSFWRKTEEAIMSEA